MHRNDIRSEADISKIISVYKLPLKAVKPNSLASDLALATALQHEFLALALHPVALLTSVTKRDSLQQLSFSVQDRTELNQIG